MDPEPSLGMTKMEFPMILNQLKTTFLLACMSGLLLFFGHLLGGNQGLLVAFIFSLLFNFVTYFYSESIVLKMYGAQPLDKEKFGWIYEIVHELCQESRMPMPKLWYLKTDMPNAFATGRSPAHSSVAVTQGILDLLERHELRGVLAHEISHIKNRDVLVATIAATMAMTIGYLADMLRWSMFFGRNNDRDNHGQSTASLIFTIILMPIAAMLIQFAISRSREYLADESGASYSHDPLALASALEKLKHPEHYRREESPSHAQTATASLFFVYPFSGKSLFNLFSTHPPLEERIKRLHKMAGIR